MTGNLSGEARLDGSAADAHCLAVCEQHPRTMMPSIERLRTDLAVRGSINHHEAVPTSHMRTLISPTPSIACCPP
jgi:hypothetical protein